MSIEQHDRHPDVVAVYRHGKLRLRVDVVLADDALADLYRRVCLILEGAAMLAAGCTSIVKNQL